VRESIPGNGVVGFEIAGGALSSEVDRASARSGSAEFRVAMRNSASRVIVAARQDRGAS
jgi:hypothetical protein